MKAIKIFSSVLRALLPLIIIPVSVYANVSGTCSSCHTMHNSQNGSTLVAEAQTSLMADSCVGCHSSSGTDTIITIGGSQVPIVYNTTAYPDKPLAGGNFYHVATDDAYGHNVWGISDPDATLTNAPGSTNSCGGGGGILTGCHFSLAVDPSLNTTMMAKGKNGCEGCHLSVKHHSVDPVAGQPENDASGWYRGLSGHYASHFSPLVPGIESSDWEQNPSSSNHNVYSARSDDYIQFNDDSSSPTITAYCVGCHETIHNQLEANVWIRHPADILLPEIGEYSSYDPVDSYNPTVPVGWTDISNRTRSTAAVICLSCHRAHGSQYPDMLRWDYTTMIANGGENNTGCFVCHSEKD